MWLELPEWSTVAVAAVVLEGGEYWNSQQWWRQQCGAGAGGGIVPLERLVALEVEVERQGYDFSW
jgi:hypothetical protein